MAGFRYTVEQLEFLQNSPLVKKPDGLPSIEKWMDVPADHNNNSNNSHANHNHNNSNSNNTGSIANRRTRTVRGGDAATEAINNPMGQFGRRQSMQPGEETVLAPPKFNFASATRASKPKETTTAVTSADGEHPGDRFPKAERSERWRERDGERTRDKTYPNGRRAAREEGESWTGSNAKGRKSLNQEDFDRGFGRNGDRDTDNGDAANRRSGNSRWGRRDENAKEGEGNNRFPAGGQGGWRDRERNREREKDREWTRGSKDEENPEWMDTPVEKESKAHTQEDFQRWLERNRANKGNKAPVEEHDESAANAGHAEEAPPPAQNPMKLMGLEPNLGGMFGTWGKDPLPDTPLEAAPPKAKPDKKSRFMGMFAKPEEHAAPVSQEFSTSSSPAPESNADREGFNRILQMLGGASLGGPPPGTSSPGIPPMTNGNRQGMPPDFPHYASPPVPEQKSRASQPSTREQQALLENILAGQQRPAGLESRASQQGRFNSMSPDNALQERLGAPRAEPRYPGEEYPLQQAPRNQNISDPNLAALLNNRREDVNRERESKEFLLTLMQQPRNTPPQMLQQNLPRQPQDQNMAFFDQPGQRPQQGQPKGRGGPPPGFIDEARMFENEMRMRHEAEHRERQLQLRELQQQEAMRNKSRGMPMGFPGHEDPAMGLQRRNTAGEIPRQLTNMGIPSQPVPDMPAMYGGRQSGMPPTPQDRPNIAPPPGFGMRQPPGLGGPGPQQQMGPGGPSFSAGNTPLGHPPGFPPPGSMPRGAFPGGPPGGNGMGPPPQGYFPPPGYGPPPPMGMRGGEDPRMMFEQFGGPGPRQPGRPGPPNMY